MKTLILLFAFMSVTQTGFSQNAMPAPKTVSPTLMQVFQLGFGSALPEARAQAFTHDVQALGDGDDTKKSKKQTAQLAVAAQALRQATLQDAVRTDKILEALGAPETIRRPFDAEVATLSAPQVVSEEAQPYVQSDPDTATVLSTLDEMDSLRSGAANETPTVRLWLKLTLGPSAIWTYDLGVLEASLDAAINAHQKPQLPSARLRALCDNIPIEMPATVRAALNQIVPMRSSSKDKADLPAPQEAFTAAHATFLKAFGIQPSQ